ncbi:hypothetical protein BCR39DRAFT_529076 [Naematelia encephala]|uniref:DUF221-domain-containing protein n=1 Tax=Naematelia encephala TaxID=71784 RepID=A0A1Y2B923_9TREE|nr:hypothetical protein BCR39DRAFT_529076 [Naematelia encephala]
MSATGKNPSSSTTPSFISALVVAGITVGVFTSLWLVLHSRRNLRRVYQPRVELAPESKRPEPLPSGVVSHWRTVFMQPDADIIIANGLDAYFFVRFLKVFGLQMLLPYFLLSCIILIPVSAASPNAGLTGLNKLTFGNVATDHENRHIAHLLVAVVLMSWTMYLLWREYAHFNEVRQGWLSSQQHLALARTRTVYIAGVPDNINSPSGIKELAGDIARLTGSANAQPRPSNVSETYNGDYTPEAGGVTKVWMTRKIKPLEKIWQEREDECSRLEGGEAKLIKLGNKNERKGKTPEKQGKLDHERGGAEMVDRFVLHKKRPTWKQGPLGLIGKKMTLETSPAYIADHNKQIDTLRAKADEYEQGNTAFVRFDSQHDAHAFARLVSKRNKLVKSGIELVPEDVVWSNISMSPYQRKIRTVVSWALTIGLIIIWAVPVAFVGLVSNVDTLCAKASWLAWICTLPKPALGIIKGVLPPVLLSLLFSLLPVVLRLWIKLQGEVRRSEIELKLFTRFWLFQVIHGFLIITLASGLVSALSGLGSMASSVPTLLATNLPGANIFFLTFILTATLSGAAKSYSRLMPFVMYLLKGILGGNTPRKNFLKTFKMDQFGWSTVFPPICLIICVTIVYSVIQPIMNLLTLVAMTLMFAAYKYILFWCADQPDSLETGGLYYIKALRTVFVSLYLEGICLAGLFFLSRDQNNKAAKSGLAGGAIMVVMIVLVALLQIYIDWFAYPKDYLVYSHSTHAILHSNGSKVNLNKSFNGVQPTQTSTEEEDENAGPELGNTTGFHGNAFHHPALWKKQPVIWIANDPLGIGKFEVARLNEAQVEASMEYAHMNAKGDLWVERGPPDEAWYGGFTSQ